MWQEMENILIGACGGLGRLPGGGRRSVRVVSYPSLLGNEGFFRTWDFSSKNRNRSDQNEFGKHTR